MNIATTNQVGHVARPFGKWITAAVAISLALVSQASFAQAKQTVAYIAPSLDIS